ncbi:MAG: pyridoxamine 5'-phosphate oxidase family protein [Spirochaetaceae bacterium]|jgi:uncharacterized pyridoxamine 5'-phosphate oxidase family protein|nr:pyridoxamine 5'-phosphate oxidase family protein [Spirochaetaceae bacterium]
MKEVLDFLSKAKVFFLATVDGDQPRVRPMGLAMDFEGKLCFGTNNKKEMYKQLKANPKMEIAATLPNGKTLRIAGPVSFNAKREAKVKALEIMPYLKNMYSPDDGIFEIFQFDSATAVFTEMNGEKEEMKL